MRGVIPSRSIPSHLIPSYLLCTSRGLGIPPFLGSPLWVFIPAFYPDGARACETWERAVAPVQGDTWGEALSPLMLESLTLCHRVF